MYTYVWMYICISVCIYIYTYIIYMNIFKTMQHWRAYSFLARMVAFRWLDTVKGFGPTPKGARATKVLATIS